jgi:hypothetical protein
MLPSIQEGSLSINPWSENPGAGQSPKTKKAILTLEQVGMLLKAAVRDKQEGIYYAFPFLTGVRPSEQLGHLERPVFGGFRTYFLCPTCDRQCDLLYSSPHIACRICHRLAFSSENETKTFRRLRQVLKRRECLGQLEGGVVVDFPPKPKWWRWPTYLRVRRQAFQQEREHWRAMHLVVNGRRKG